MESLLKADIFFFITTMAIVLLTIALVVILVYFIKILRDVRYMARKAKEETDEIVKDVDLFRAALKKRAREAGATFNSFNKFFKFKKGLPRRQAGPKKKK